MNRATVFSKELVTILALQGVTIGSDGLLSRIPGFIGHGQPTDAQLRFMNERRRNRGVNGQLRYNWVIELDQMSEALDTLGTSAPWPCRTTFWIRLHGVISDLRGECLELFRNLQVDPMTFVADPGSDLDLELERFHCIEMIRRSFTEDELIYADYLRQTNGHPTQAQYDVRWSNANGGQVNDRRRINTIGREFTVEELDLAVQRVLFANVKNGLIDESVIATVFARRIKWILKPLLFIMRRMTTPN